MPLVNREATKRLRELIKRPRSTVAIVGVLPIQAILAEQAGFELFWISGGTYHMWYLGVPDSGQWTSTEFVEYARRITASVEIPVVSDLDVAGGNPVNVYRTVKDLIRAGVAGCHIEDVQYPKGITVSGLAWKPGGGPGLGLHDDELLVTVEEQVGRLKAAMEARDELDPDFVIIARTDARGAHGGSLEESIQRAKEYEKAGVDMVMFDGMRSWEECRTALKSVRLPALCAGSPVPAPSFSQRQADGDKFMLFFSWQGALQAGWDELMAFKERDFAVLNERRQAEEKRPASQRVPRNSKAVEKIVSLQQKYLPKSR